ncbi:Septum formation protein Maf [invertebrate metagenome]|uniref:Septum formation protein Maf n=1 Tax=invertebrate metagenome TaxID=1711999 RepID=A0A484H5U2_9ZZZZ
MFVLASTSPWQLALLRQIAIVPMAVDPTILNERPHWNERPASYVVRLARERAAVVAEQHVGLHVLAANTVVSCGRRLLSKTETIDDARRCLDLLSGRRHRVYGGICLRTPQGRSAVRVVATIVTFKRLDDHERRAYLAAGEWHGQVGGYAIQGEAAAFVRFITGSYSNVVGLPLYETATLLKGAGLWDLSPWRHTVQVAPL